MDIKPANPPEVPPPPPSLLPSKRRSPPQSIKEKSQTNLDRSHTIQTVAIPVMTSSEKEKETMKQVHFTLQGKGGVGKSFVSSLLVQHLRANGYPVTAIDTDPVNATLAGYEAFGTKRLELMENGSLIERNFDKLIEQIVTEDTHFVIDNGAASFIPLSYYLSENDAINLIGQNGKKVLIHTVITGGQAIRDTLSGFASLVEQIPGDIELVVWLNEFFGDIESEGKSFEEMQIYQSNKDRVRGIVRIARQTGSTFGEDVKMMLDKKLTFDEVTQSSDFGLMAKSRLAKVRKSIFEQLDVVI